MEHNPSVFKEFWKAKLQRKADFASASCNDEKLRQSVWLHPETKLSWADLNYGKPQYMKQIRGEKNV